MTRATHFDLHPWSGWKRPMTEQGESSFIGYLGEPEKPTGPTAQVAIHGHAVTYTPYAERVEFIVRKDTAPNYDLFRMVAYGDGSSQFVPGDDWAIEFDDLTDFARFRSVLDGVYELFRYAMRKP